MGQLYIPGQKNISGPWLLEIPELEELSEVFNFIEGKINDSFLAEMKEEAENDLVKGRYKDLESALSGVSSYYEKRKSKKAVLISSDEKRLVDNSLTGILRDPKIKDLRPKELNLEIDFGPNNKFNFQIKTRFDGEVEYTCKCFLQNSQEEIMYKIENWMEKHQPNKAKQIWLNHSFTIIYLSGLLALISAAFIVTTKTFDFKPLYKLEIERLIKTKVNSQNQNQAIELLLKYVIDYNPKINQQVQIINKLPVQLCSISIFCFLIGIFKPRTSIGIGCKKKSTKFYKVYSNFVLFTIPLTLIVPPIVDLVRQTLFY